MNFKEYLSYFKQVVDKEVEGWFYPKDIIIIYGILNEIQKPVGDICEIGVAFGKSAVIISQFKANNNFYLYDIFTEEARITAENNIIKFGDNSNLIWRLQDTTQLNTDDVFFENKLRFLHIDGCHEHSAVLNDLMLFSNKMRDDGIPQHSRKIKHKINWNGRVFLVSNPHWRIKNQGSSFYRLP